MAHLYPSLVLEGALHACAILRERPAIVSLVHAAHRPPRSTDGLLAKKPAREKTNTSHSHDASERSPGATPTEADPD